MAHDIAPERPKPMFRGSNQSGMRAHNERLVLSILRRQGPLAKAGIARATGLSPQTISVIMRALENDGLLVKCDPVRGKVGQPLVPLRLAENGAFFLGLKIGRRSADLVLTNFLGTVLGRAQLSYALPTPDVTLRFATDSVARLVAQLSPEEQLAVAGLGIAMPFRLWDWGRPSGTAHTEMAMWRERDIAAEIAAATGLPILLQNDASAACNAELVFGQGMHERDFLYFYVGYFSGGGLVLNGSVFTGRSGNAAALGSMPLAGPDGTNRQLIDLASLATLDAMVTASGHETDSLWRSPEAWKIDGAILADWVADASAALAFAIVAAASVVDVNTILIDGWIPSAVRTALVEGTRRALDGMVLSGLDATLRVEAGTIGPDARALGAASLVLSQKFLVDQHALLVRA